MEEGPKIEENKPEYAILPWDAIEELARVFEYGSIKYKKPFTYRIGITVSKLVSASIRHLLQWFYYRQEIDPETGCHHLAHCAANALMILSSIMTNGSVMFDDRPE